jgi:hypothetical protein
VIGQTGPSTISVTGTCNENVTLNNARSLTIFAGPGGARIVGPQDSDTFDIFLSQDITLQDLEIVGTPGTTVATAGGGVFISDASEVHIVRCNVHDNQGGGVFADTGSLLFLNHTTIQNNTPGDGLDVTNNSSADVVGSTIQNNGLAVTGGIGVFVLDRSSVVFRQKNFILNNGDIGILALTLSNVGFATAFPDRITTIQGHNTNGVVIIRQSHLQVNGAAPHVITGNGSACPLDPTCGGVYANRNSTVNVNIGTITANQGAGISVEQGANFVLNNATVSNNSGDGVRLKQFSIGNIGSGNSITGNGGASVFCDERSLVNGDLTGISKVNCDRNDPPDKSRHGADDKDKEGKERNH